MQRLQKDQELALRHAIGERFGALVAAEGQTQRDLAAVFGVSQPAVAQMIAGVLEVRAIHVARLVSLYQVSANWLQMGVGSIYRLSDPRLAKWFRCIDAHRLESVTTLLEMSGLRLAVRLVAHQEFSGDPTLLEAVSVEPEKFSLDASDFSDKISLVVIDEDGFCAVTSPTSAPVTEVVRLVTKLLVSGAVWMGASYFPSGSVPGAAAASLANLAEGTVTTEELLSLFFLKDEAAAWRDFEDAIRFWRDPIHGGRLSQPALGMLNQPGSMRSWRGAALAALRAASEPAADDWLSVLMKQSMRGKTDAAEPKINPGTGRFQRRIVLPRWETPQP